MQIHVTCVTYVTPAIPTNRRSNMMTITPEPEGYRPLDPQIVENIHAALNPTPEEVDRRVKAGFTNALHRAQGFIHYDPDRAARLADAYDLQEVRQIANGITAFVEARIAYQGAFPEFVLDPIVELGADDADTLFAAWDHTEAPTEGEPS